MFRELEELSKFAKDINNKVHIKIESILKIAKEKKKYLVIDLDEMESLIRPEMVEEDIEIGKIEVE